jgi:hypothetical protein
VYASLFKTRCCMRVICLYMGQGSIVYNGLERGMRQVGRLNVAGCA